MLTALVACWPHVSEHTRTAGRADAEGGFRIPVEAPCATALPSRSDGFGLRLREFEIDRALCHSQKYSLRRDEKRRWTVERRGAGSSIFLFFFELLSPLDHGPSPPQNAAPGPMDPFQRDRGRSALPPCGTLASLALQRSLKYHERPHRHTTS